MEPRQAVAAAKTALSVVFAEEAQATAPTLEEIWFEPGDQLWCVTLGLHRRSGLTFGPLLDPTVFKVVRIRDKDGSLVSIKNREGERAA